MHENLIDVRFEDIALKAFIIDIEIFSLGYHLA
jgi:hypothetical protein